MANMLDDIFGLPTTRRPRSHSSKSHSRKSSLSQIPMAADTAAAAATPLPLSSPSELSVAAATLPTLPPPPPPPPPPPAETDADATAAATPPADVPPAPPPPPLLPRKVSFSVSADAAPPLPPETAAELPSQTTAGGTPLDDVPLPSSPSPPSLPDGISLLPQPMSQPALLIALCGPPCSGKHLLGQLLLRVFSNAFVIWQEDFVVPRRLLVPEGRTGRVEVGMKGGVNWVALEKVVEWVGREGRVPEGLGAVGREGTGFESASVGEEVWARLREEVNVAGVGERRVGIVIGTWVLTHDGVRGLLDGGLVLRGARDRAIERWAGKGRDQGEFGEMWRSYGDEYGALFRGGDVEGRPNSRVCQGLGISVQPLVDGEVEENVSWAVGEIVKRLKEKEEERDDELEERGRALDEFQLCDCGETWLGKVRQVLLNLV